MLTNHPHFVSFSFETKHLEINPNGIIIIGIDSKTTTTPDTETCVKPLLHSFRRRMIIYFHESRSLPPLVSLLWKEVEKLAEAKKSTRIVKNERKKTLWKHEYQPPPKTKRVDVLKIHSRFHSCSFRMFNNTIGVHHTQQGWSFDVEENEWPCCCCCCCRCWANFRIISKNHTHKVEEKKILLQKNKFQQDKCFINEVVVSRDGWLDR